MDDEIPEVTESDLRPSYEAHGIGRLVTAVEPHLESTEAASKSHIHASPGVR